MKRRKLLPPNFFSIPNSSPSSLLISIIFILCQLFVISTSIDSSCLDKLCKLESGCNPSEKCLGSGSAHCGPFHLSTLYWKAAGKPGLDFDTCIFDIDCSKSTVKRYMEKFSRDCDGDGRVTCIDAIAIQKAGPLNCHEGWIYETGYFKRFMAMEGFALGTSGHDDHGNEGTNSGSDHIPEESFFNETRVTTNSLEFRARGRNPRRDERFRPTRNPRRPYTIVYWPVDDPRLVTEAPRRGTRKPWIISVGERNNPTSRPRTRPTTTLPSSGETVPTRRRSRPRSRTTPVTRPTRPVATRRSRTTERPRSSTSIWTTRTVTSPPVSFATTRTIDTSGPASTTVYYAPPTAAITRATTARTTTTSTTTTTTRPPTTMPISTPVPTVTPRPVFTPRVAVTTAVPTTTRPRTKPTFNPTRTPKSTTSPPPTDWTSMDTDPTTPRKPVTPSRAPNETVSKEITPFKESCLECICIGSSGCNYGAKFCDGKEGECGPYRIDYAYWYEAGYPGYEGNEGDFRKCVQNRECAESTVKAYIARYTKDCNDDGMIDCIDYAALHKGGPSECSKNWVYESKFWTTFQDCTGFDFRRKR